MPQRRAPETHEERQAAWEKDLVEELRLWREHGNNIGVSSPQYLTTHVFHVRQQVAFMDQFVMTQKADPALTSGEYTDAFFYRQYEKAEKAWEARERFLKDLFARQASGMTPLSIPPSGSNEADPDSE